MLDLEEFGSLWRYYKCPFEGCDKNTGRAKSIGYYKEFAIHCGVMHGVHREVGRESELDGAQELRLSRAGGRQKARSSQRCQKSRWKRCTMHLCNRADKESIKICRWRPRKIHSTRYHYASCLTIVKCITICMTLRIRTRTQMEVPGYSWSRGEVQLQRVCVLKLESEGWAIRSRYPSRQMSTRD